MSRTIGDYAFKPPGKLPAQSLPVSPAPDINVVARERNGDEFLLIASDGVFKSLTSSQVVDFVLRQLQITDDLTKICRNLIDMAYFAVSSVCVCCVCVCVRECMRVVCVCVCVCVYVCACACVCMC